MDWFISRKTSWRLTCCQWFRRNLLHRVAAEEGVRHRTGNHLVPSERLIAAMVWNRANVLRSVPV